MEFSASFRGRERKIVDLFTAVFTDSGGPENGSRIGALVGDLLDNTPEEDRFVFVAGEGGEVVGAIVFSRLCYDGDDRIVFILSPVAVATDRQGQGIGRKLVTCGLNALRAAGVDIAMTYGDPNYYSRIGFGPVAEASASAPFALSCPNGWLGQSLTDAKMTPLKGISRSVAALNDPALW